MTDFTIPSEEETQQPIILTVGHLRYSFANKSHLEQSLTIRASAKCDGLLQHASEVYNTRSKKFVKARRCGEEYANHLLEVADAT